MNIVCIGAGNVASHLVADMHGAGHQILQVYSRTAERANKLALEVGSQAINDLKAIHQDADIYFIAVRDDAIPEIVSSLNIQNKIVVHTSGSVDMNLLKAASPHVGVFYPLQTFSSGRVINMLEVPVFIEASDEPTLTALHTLADSISDEVYEADSGKRRILHIAAVIAANFSNHMYNLSASFLEKNGLSFDILKPLIMETASKIMEIAPSDAQTGPAARNDQGIINAHLEALSGDLHLQEIYRKLTESIIRKS